MTMWPACWWQQRLDLRSGLVGYLSSSEDPPPQAGSDPGRAKHTKHVAGQALVMVLTVIGGVGQD
jgi:hypothetical protein